jgi:hypothetical protein
MWTTEKQKPVAHIPTASTAADRQVNHTILFEQEKMHLNDSTFGVLTMGSTLSFFFIWFSELISFIPHFCNIR